MYGRRYYAAGPYAEGLKRARLAQARIFVATSANVAAGGEATTLAGTGSGFAPPTGKTTGDWVNGRRWDDENGVDSLDPGAADKWTVVGWIVQANSGAVSDGEQYEFRVVADGAPLDTYAVTPQWTIGTPPPERPAGLRSEPPFIDLDASYAASDTPTQIAPSAPVWLSQAQPLSLAVEPAFVAISGQQIQAAVGHAADAGQIVVGGVGVAFDATQTAQPAGIAVSGLGVSFAVSAAADPASIVVGGQDITQQYGSFLTVDPASVEITGAALSQQIVAGVQAADVVVSGQSVAFSLALSVGTSSVKIDGQDASFDVSWRVDPAGVVINGADVELQAGQSFQLAVDPADVVASGAAVSAAVALVAQPTEVAVSGQDHGFDFTFGVDPASLVLSGQDVALQAGGSQTLQVDPSSVVISGSDAQASVTFAVQAGQVSILGGQVSAEVTEQVTQAQIAASGEGVLASVVTTADAGQVAISGAALAGAVVEPVLPGDVVVSGADVQFSATDNRQLDVQSAPVVVSGQQIASSVSKAVEPTQLAVEPQTLAFSVLLPVGAGSVVISGHDIDGTVSGSATLSVDAGALVVSGADVSLSVEQPEEAATSPKKLGGKRKARYPNLELRPPRKRKDEDEEPQQQQDDGQAAQTKPAEEVRKTRKPVVVGRGIAAPQQEQQRADEEQSRPRIKVAKPVEAKRKRGDEGAGAEELPAPSKPDAPKPKEAAQAGSQAVEEKLLAEAKSLAAEEITRQIEAIRQQILDSVRSEIRDLAQQLARERAQRMELEREIVRTRSNKIATELARMMLEDDVDLDSMM